MKFIKCVVCTTDRDVKTIDSNGRCPFCADARIPESAEKKVRQKRTTTVKIEPAQAPQPVLEVANPDYVPYTPPQYVAPEDPMQELAQRELCRRKLLPFVQRFRPKYVAGWVHEDICTRLERFVKAVANGEEPRMLLMMPPRSGKSEIGSRNFPAWVLGQYPEWEIIAASHTSSLSLSFSRYIRDLMRDPAYHSVFENGRLDTGSQALDNWNTTHGGGYLAAGVGTGITGRGAHILLLDDLVKDIEAADSATISENTWEWYGSTAYTRLAPGGGVLGIMTWWSENDWAGRIQSVMESGEGDIFEVVKYPAINDVGDEYILEKLPGQPIIQLGPKHPELDPDSGPRLTRLKNTAVHPARYTTEAMLRIKRNLIATGQKRIWDALYQQNPLPDEGLSFRKDMFRYYAVAPARHGRRIAQAWDFAITEEKRSDYTVGTTLLQDEYDNFYVLDVNRFKSDDGEFIVEEILNYAKEWDADLLGFEDGQIWKSIFSTFERRCTERKQFPPYEILQPLTDKVVRAGPLKGRMQIGKVFFNKNAPWFTELEREMLRFPAGKHDDQVDSLSWCVRTLLTQAAPRIEDQTPKKPESWMNRLFAKGSGSVSHMAS